MTKLIVNCETGETTERQLNVEELAQQAIDQTAEAAQYEAEAAKVAEKEALLARLGITADEAKLLLS
jgi:hypothetical protein